MSELHVHYIVEVLLACMILILVKLQTYQHNTGKNVLIYCTSTEENMGYIVS